jgi:site-specific recombinase XerD
MVKIVSDELSDLLRSFQIHVRAEGRAPRTVTIYSQAVQFFAAWLTDQGRPATTDELTKDNIRRWLAELGDTKKPGTVLTRHIGLHRFGRWLVAEEILTKHPMDGLEQPQVPASPVPVLSDEQLAALLKACAGARFYDRRDEAVIRLLLDSGLRVSELCGLPRWKPGEGGAAVGIDVADQMGIVLGKGSKARAFYFGARTARALDRYLRARAKHRHADSHALFLGERGALTPDGVREILRVRAETAGIGHVHPHQLRHTHAHDFLLHGGQERDLKRLMGWSSDTMLEIYGASAADVRAASAARRMRRGDRV